RHHTHPRPEGKGTAPQKCVQTRQSGSSRARAGIPLAAGSGRSGSSTIAFSNGRVSGRRGLEQCEIHDPTADLHRKGNSPSPVIRFKLPVPAHLAACSARVGAAAETDGDLMSTTVRLATLVAMLPMLLGM